MSITNLMPWRHKEHAPRRRGEVTVNREEDHPLTLFERDMNRMFDDFFGGFGLAPSDFWDTDWSAFSPQVDIVDNENEIKVSVELPGLDEKDIDVNLSRDTLIISGEKQQEKEDKGKNYYRMERSYGSFKRAIPIPCEIKTEAIDATFKNGVLSVVLPKATEGQCRQKIAVKTE
jgi:HSP20 family protein